MYELSPRNFCLHNIPRHANSLSKLVLILLAISLSGSITGCLEVQQFLNGFHATNGNSNSSNGDPTTPNTNENSNTTGTVPTVNLTVTNPSPQVNEEVLLTCQVISGFDTTTTFQFEPIDGRLFANTATGTASLIIEASDVGRTFSFSCTATNNQGVSEPSNIILITPT